MKEGGGIAYGQQEHGQFTAPEITSLYSFLAALSASHCTAFVQWVLDYEAVASGTSDGTYTMVVD